MKQGFRTLILLLAVLGGLGGGLLLASVIISAGFPTETLAVFGLAGGLSLAYHSMYVLEHGIPYTPRKWRSKFQRDAYKLTAQSAFFLARSGFLFFMFSVMIIMLLLAGFLAREAFVSVNTYLNVTPPELSGTLITATAAVLTVILSIFGGRKIEAKRAVHELQREKQKDLYPQILSVCTDLQTDMERTDLLPRLDTLRREATLIASNEVLEAFSDLMQLHKRKTVEGVAPESLAEEYEKGLHTLISAMRKDLGFSRQLGSAPWLWRKLDPTEKRLEPREEPEGLWGRITAPLSMP